MNINNLEELTISTAIANKLLKPDNRQFSDKELRVIGPNGEQLGLMKLLPACQAAKNAGLDLVIVSETSVPPVCKIMDFGKLCYEQKKKLKDQKKNQQAQKVKEIKFRLHIDTHDYEVKIAHAIDFLMDGCKLKVTITFKGREMAHPEMGFELVQKITESLEEHGTVDAPAKLLGKNICMSFNPKAAR